jgi:two-component system sensor histidine kinase YesM
MTMNKLLFTLKERFKALPLQKKLFYSYSIPVVAICVMTSVVSYFFFSTEYKRQYRHIQTQSCVQAANFISQYLGNMYYISSLMENSAAMTTIISGSGLSGDRAIDDQYREFWSMNNELMKISVSNSTYRIGIYIPDDLVYAINSYYFYPETELKRRPDFPEIYRNLSADVKYFVPLTEITSHNPVVRKDDYLALLGSIKSSGTEGNGWRFITKVEIPTAEFEKVLQKANTMRKGLVYLLSNDGRFIAASDSTEYARLRHSGNFPANRTALWKKVKLPGGEYYVLWYGIQKYGWQLFCLIPLSEYRSQGNFIVTVILLILVLLATAVFAVSYALSSFYTRRLTALSRNMEELGRGRFKSPDASVSAQSGDEIDGIHRNFDRMAEELQRLMEDHYRQGKSVVTAELRALQSQINPHFLYNTLDLINWEAMKYKAANISEIAQSLGLFYRLSLNHGKVALQVKNELRHVEAFVRIENVHFDGAIHLEIIVPEMIRERACLGIILQPFVENSIVHGIAAHPEITECSICISAEFDDADDIVFEIRDNGPGMSGDRQRQVLDGSEDHLESGYGIRNINSRLKLCYGEMYGVSFDSAPGKGTTVHVRIPSMTLEQLEKRLR